MEWDKLLSEKRIRELVEGIPAKQSPDERTEHGRDYDRAIFSTPVRRMQDKTQVFPLDPNDSVRTRLTHSLEVSNIARNMARGIGDWLLEEGELKNSRQRDSIESIAATCGLIHDLGNPPFGHAGEKAIQEWFKYQDRKDSDLKEKKFFRFVEGFGNDEQLKNDFLMFEGNAQTIRLISKLQVLADFHGLNLTCATMSAACKYISPSNEINEDLHEKSKLGYFASEQGLINKIQEETGTFGKRNPIAYIVESADDIAYSVVDIEDGVKKGVISWDNLKEKLEEEIELSKKFPQRESEILQLCFTKADEYLKRADSSILEKGKPLDNAMAQTFRVFAIIQSAEAIKKAFKEKYQNIKNGDYHDELYKDSEAGALIEACKQIGIKYIYPSDENLKLELMGRRVIHDLMDIFWEGASTGNKKEKGFARKIFDLTSRNYRVVYEEALKEKKLPGKYCSMQLMTDYICGMTDTFACTLHKRLTNG